MSNKQHTPGPWIIIPTMSGNPFIYDKATGKNVAGVAMVREWMDREESEANARLIAAAPELLAILEELIDIEGPQPGTKEWADKARAAIAKSKGE